MLSREHSIALKEALTWVESNFEAVGIIVCGSIVRGNPDKHSDFDIFVIHNAIYRQRVQKKFNYIPCEIFVNNPDHIRGYFESELAANRPVTAHMIATGEVVKGSNDPMVQKLVEEAGRYQHLAKELTPDEIVFQRYAIANLFEDVTDILGKDKATAAYILNKLMIDCIHLEFILQRKPLPRIKERLKQLREISPAMGLLVERFYAAKNLHARYELAAHIVMYTSAETGFFEWISTPGV